jgi:hypothetical protein
LERLDRDKNSATFINYGCKKFYNIGPRRLVLKTGFWRKLTTAEETPAPNSGIPIIWLVVMHVVNVPKVGCHVANELG